MRKLIFATGLVALGAGSVRAADADFFEKKVRPVFVEHCYKCHSAQAPKLRGGLRLDTVAGIRTGGETGPLFVPGKPKESLLVAALRHEDKAMPPTGKLPEGVINDVAAWVERGAVLPTEVASSPAPRGVPHPRRRSAALGVPAAEAVGCPRRQGRD